MLTKVSALELSKYRIRVNSVSPGFTRTPMTENLYPNEEMWLKSEKDNPSGRVGNPIDVANAVLFLLSESAEYINGANIDVNGGSFLT
jgi:NAD(P)-dependent dehydrogenase (short-subunit alcohol dehydrogenase family)